MEEAVSASISVRPRSHTETESCFSPLRSVLLVYDPRGEPLPRLCVRRARPAAASVRDPSFLLVCSAGPVCLSAAYESPTLQKFPGLEGRKRDFPCCQTFLRDAFVFTLLSSYITAMYVPLFFLSVLTPDALNLSKIRNTHSIPYLCWITAAILTCFVFHAEQDQVFHKTNHC